MFQQTTSTRRNSRRRQVLLGLLLVMITVCLPMFILEIVARLLSPPYDAEIGEFFECHNSVGWIGAPNFQGKIEDPAFRQELTFNSLGMHDTEHPLEKAPHTFRILMLGDSFIQAVQVSEVATAHQVLEDYLNEQAGQHHFEVLSGGVINWGTNQQLIYYREQGRRFQPDLVLLALYIGNDFSDNLPGNVLTTKGHNCYAPYFAVCDSEFIPEPLIYGPGISRIDNNCAPLRRVWINGMGTLYQHSRLYQQIEPLLAANYPRQQFGAGYPLAFTPLYLPNQEAHIKQAWQITEGTIAQLQQEVREDGGQFAVAIISPDIIIRLGAFSPAEQAVFLSDNPDFTEAQLDRPNQQLADFLKRQNIPFIDLTQPMIEHWATYGIPLYLLGEGHWTVEGNRLAAEQLAQWLIQSNLVPQNAQ